MHFLIFIYLFLFCVFVVLPIMAIGCPPCTGDSVFVRYRRYTMDPFCVFASFWTCGACSAPGMHLKCACRSPTWKAPPNVQSLTGLPLPCPVAWPLAGRRAAQRVGGRCAARGGAPRRARRGKRSRQRSSADPCRDGTRSGGKGGRRMEGPQVGNAVGERPERVEGNVRRAWVVSSGSECAALSPPAWSALLLAWLL